MTKREQAALIRAYCRDQQKYLLSKLKDVPPEWDGRQLRNWFWIAAKAGYEFDLGRAGVKSLRNDIAVRNL